MKTGIKMKTKKNRIRNGLIAIFAVTFTLLYLADEPVSISSFTGMVIIDAHPSYEYHTNEVIISGLSFTAEINGIYFHYIFSDDGWYESDNLIDWEKRTDMGASLFLGLNYLESYDAKIYFKNKEVTDFTEFAKSLR